ncbi:MAG: hypothetical protein ACXVA9_08805 [Bdellovibrionales bacterium]
MNYVKFLISGIFLTIGLGANATCLGENMSPDGESKNTLLSNALADLNGFSYIRNQLNAWRSEGDTICATGIPLEKNIYQYFRWFIQIEVRSADGKLKALVPALFQTASVQAHDNTGPKPWVVVPYTSAQSILANVRFVAQEKLASFPSPADSGFRAAVSTASWARSFDNDSFSVTPLAEPDLYLLGWLAMVPGTGGNVFTQLFSPKTVLLRYLPDGSVEIDQSHSGYGEFLSPLDTLLNSIRPPVESEAKQELVRQFSEIPKD